MIDRHDAVKKTKGATDEGHVTHVAFEAGHHAAADEPEPAVPQSILDMLAQAQREAVAVSVAVQSKATAEAAVKDVDAAKERQRATLAQIHAAIDAAYSVP